MIERIDLQSCVDLTNVTELRRHRFWVVNIGMPRVVPDQREKFDNDELFRKLSRESEVSVWYIVDRQTMIYGAI